MPCAWRFHAVVVPARVGSAYKFSTSFFAQSHTIDGSARHGADCHLGAHLACLSSLHPSHAASIARASIKVGAECVQGSTTVCMQAGSMHILEIKESTHAGFTCARMQIHKMDAWYIIHQCSTQSRIHPHSALNPPTLLTRSPAGGTRSRTDTAAGSWQRPSEAR